MLASEGRAQGSERIITPLLSASSCRLLSLLCARFSARSYRIAQLGPWRRRIRSAPRDHAREQSRPRSLFVSSRAADPLSRWNSRAKRNERRDADSMRWRDKASWKTQASGMEITFLRNTTRARASCPTPAQRPALAPTAGLSCPAPNSLERLHSGHSSSLAPRLRTEQPLESSRPRARLIAN